MTFLSNRLRYHQITPDVQCNTSGYTSVCTHQVGSAGLPSASKGRHWTWDRDGMDGKTGRVTDENVTTHNCSPLYCVSPGDGSQAGRLSSELLSWWNIFLAQAGFYHFLFSVCACLCMCKWVSQPRDTMWKAENSFLRVHSLLLCWFKESNSGPQTWKQASLPTEPSRLPLKSHF